MSVGKQQEIPIMTEVKPLKNIDISQIQDAQGAILLSEKMALVNRDYANYANLLGYRNSGAFSKFRNGIAAQIIERLILLMEANGNLAPLQYMAKKLGVQLKPPQTEKERLDAEIERLLQKRERLAS